MTYVVTAEEMRELDRATIEGIGVPGAVLMEHAGRAVADRVLALAPAGPVVVLCGAGNNGGDGYVCARWLRERGVDATVHLCAGRPRPGDAALHLSIYEKLGGPVLGPPDGAALTGAAVIVDALFGTGLSKPIEGTLGALIVAANASPAVRVAVDIPSGIHADTGQVLGVAFTAHHTVTFAFPKVGLVSHPGFERAGRLHVVDIGIPEALATRARVALRLLDDETVAALVPARDLGAHKGTHGHALIVAGSAGKPGAALLCALGALRGGAGLVTLATSPDARASVEGRLLEAMYATVDLERPAVEAVATLAALAEGKGAVACGPGIPSTAEARASIRAVVGAIDVPLVLDADALNHLAPDPGLLRGVHAPVVLTPHPGEAARLLSTTTAEVQADRVGAARRLAEASGAVTILKGARTVIAAPSGTAAINPTGNPGMASGGTGDVLCGLVAALLCQGIGPWNAARAAAYLHGRAGDLVAKRQGARGLLAHDLADSLPAAFESIHPAP